LRQNAEFLEEVLDAAAPFKDGKKLTERLGKKITELEFAAMLSGRRRRRLGQHWPAKRPRLRSLGV
jgi:hypothetical protein